jgi:hypothetical protein
LGDLMIGAVAIKVGLPTIRGGVAGRARKGQAFSRGDRCTPASMQRTEPPASSMVGMCSGNRRALRTASTDGVRTLALIGDANDRVVLDQTEWSRTGSMVDEAGHNYVVYSGSNDASVQLLIDQQMLTTLLTN